MSQFQSIGTITYDPTAGKAKNAWWMILECPQDILDYYYHWTTETLGVKLNKPLFGSHVSVIRGEEPPEELKSLWQKYHEQEVEFTYSHDVQNDGQFYWIPVQCRVLNDIRKELGLTADVQFDFHLTIGRTI